MDRQGSEAVIIYTITVLCRPILYLVATDFVKELYN